jgi:hypothetical protein
MTESFICKKYLRNVVMKKNNTRLFKYKSVNTSFVSDLNLKDKDNLLKISMGTYDFEKVQSKAKDYLKDYRRKKDERNPKHNDNFHSGSKRKRDTKQHKHPKHKSHDRHDRHDHDDRHDRNDHHDRHDHYDHYDHYDHHDHPRSEHRDKNMYENDGWGPTKEQRTYSDSSSRN